MICEKCKGFYCRPGHPYVPAHCKACVCDAAPPSAKPLERGEGEGDRFKPISEAMERATRNGPVRF